jgi:hypothetical protein
VAPIPNSLSIQISPWLSTIFFMDSPKPEDLSLLVNDWNVLNSSLIFFSNSGPLSVTENIESFYTINQRPMRSFLSLWAIALLIIFWNNCCTLKRSPV